MAMRLSAVRRNVLLLATCQALNGTALSIVILVAPLAGQILAEDKMLATLPQGVQWLFTMMVAFPASMLMRRYGRRLGFMSAEAFYITGSLLSIYALVSSQFMFLWIGACFLGSGNGFAVFYRFAAADAADPSYRGRAISYVLAGGVIAGFIGPEIAAQTRDLIGPALFMGSYAAIIVIALIKATVLTQLKMPRPTTRERSAHQGRPLREIARQPRFVVAIASSMMAWGVMVLLMASTPLAMFASQHAFSDSALVIQWHIVGMYAPSFITGALIVRFGLANVMLTGTLLQVGAVAINLFGMEVWNFWASNLIQGIGWNFLFVGGSTLLTTTYTQAERAKVQGLNDLLVFGTAALAAFGSGALHQLLGWQTVNLAVAPLILLVMMANFWLRRMPAPQPAQ
jgi:MFS family permease